MYKFIFDNLILPIAPSKLTIKVGNKNKTVDLISIGETNILKNTGLITYSFDILLPRTRYPFMPLQMEFKEPLFYLDKFRDLKNSKKPFTFEIIRLMPNGIDLFNGYYDVSLEDYTIKENAGEEGDFWVSLNLKEYRLPRVKKIKLISDKKTEIAEAKVEIQREHKEIEPEYTIKKGDTLRKIAKLELNDETKYMEIAILNNIKDPNKIYTGSILKLPT